MMIIIEYPLSYYIFIDDSIKVKLYKDWSNIISELQTEERVKPYYLLSSYLTRTHCDGLVSNTMNWPSILSASSLKKQLQEDVL